MYDTLKKTANAVRTLGNVGGWIVDNGVLLSGIALYFILTKDKK